MLKRELKVNLKSCILWTCIVVGILLFTYSIYPLIMNDESMKSMDELMKSMPNDFLKSFNMDITDISTAYGWLKSEGFMFVLIITGLYSSMLGYNIVLKEEYEGTIEYLHNLPVTRNKILTNKIIVGLIYVFGMALAISLFNVIALLISCEVDLKELLMLSISPLFVMVPLFSFSLFASTCFKKKSNGFCLGIVFIFYLLSILCEISKNVEFLKYFTLYTLADTRGIIENQAINPLLILISIAISVLFIILSYINYNKKELV